MKDIVVREAWKVVKQDLLESMNHEEESLSSSLGEDIEEMRENSNHEELNKLLFEESHSKVFEIALKNSNTLGQLIFNIFRYFHMRKDYEDFLDDPMKKLVEMMAEHKRRRKH